MAGKTTKKQARKGRARRARAPMRRRLPANVPERGSCSDLREAQILETNQMYGPSVISIKQFDRASAMARLFQEYRITKVKFTFKPLFDTFQATTNGASQIAVPYFYYMIDKPGAIPTTASLATLQAMGAKPRRFDDKSIHVQWSPAFALSDIDNPLVKPYISPWLNTNATPQGATWTCSDAGHFGLWYYLDAPNLPGDGQYEFECDVEIQVQYRKPLLPTTAGGTESLNQKMTFKTTTPSV